MKDLSYFIGRLQGLNELVKILKDLVDKKGTQDAEIVTVITDHIADQLGSILKEFDNAEAKPKQKDALMELKEKHTEAALPKPEEKLEPIPEEGPKEKLEKHEKTVDDLLKDLETLKS